MGTTIGFFMGYLLQTFKLPPFIITLAGLYLGRGLCYVVSIDTIAISNEFFQKAAQHQIHIFGRNFVSPSAIIGIVVLLAGFFILRFTKFGRTVYAIRLRAGRQRNGAGRYCHCRDRWHPVDGWGGQRVWHIIRGPDIRYYTGTCYFSRKSQLVVDENRYRISRFPFLSDSKIVRIGKKRRYEKKPFPAIPMISMYQPSRPR